jgi:hypothetical protein
VRERLSLALLAIILSAGTGVASTRASALPVDLTWVAPPGCPDVDTIRSGIAHRIREGGETVANVLAKVVVSRIDADQWQAKIDLRGADWTATRTLEGRTCLAVSDAAGLVMVLALNSNAEDRTVVAVTPPPPPPPSPPESSPFLGVGAATDVGALPGPASGGGVAVGWRLEHASLELDANLFAPQQASVVGRPDIGAKLWLATLDLRGCYLFGARISLGPCVAAGLAWTRMSVFGPALSHGNISTAPVLGTGLRGEWWMSRRVGAFLVAEVAFPLTTPQLSVQFNNDVRPVNRASVVSVRCAAGLEVRFR